MDGLIPDRIRHTYWFTVAVGETHEAYARDLQKSCERHGIALDVLRPTDPENPEQAKFYKIEGIRQAPDWARRIVFMDADTLLIDPVDLLDHDGAMDAPKRPHWRQSGVIAGPPRFMRELAEVWAQKWHEGRKHEDFRGDQDYFSPAYDEVAPKYDIKFLPKRCNYLVKRWHVGETWPSVLHRAGNLWGRKGDQWQKLRRAIRKGHHIDPWGPAPKQNAWSGGRWSFAVPYQKALDFLRPTRVAEWGPGANTLMAVTSGATHVTAHEGHAQYAHNYRLVQDQLELSQVTTHVIDEQDEAYTQLPDPEAEVFFVDGRNRSTCLKAIREQAHPWAVAVLHDASRKRYRDELLRFPYVVYLDGTTAVASQSPRILRLHKPKKK